jgi:hypothetical protein
MTCTDCHAPLDAHQPDCASAIRARTLLRESARNNLARWVAAEIAVSPSDILSIRIGGKLVAVGISRGQAETLRRSM